LLKYKALKRYFSAGDSVVLTVPNTMADLSRRSPLGTLPANRLLAPGAHNLEIPLARYGLARLRDQLFGSGDEHAGVVDQLATPLDVDMTDRGRC